MASQDAFDPHTFLAHVGAGRTRATHRRQSPIFAQGAVADAVFDLQRGQVQRAGEEGERLRSTGGCSTLVDDRPLVVPVGCRRER
jgi:hypothetical protein